MYINSEVRCETKSALVMFQRQKCESSIAENILANTTGQ